jgi:hypothetical protein
MLAFIPVFILLGKRWIKDRPQKSEPGFRHLFGRKCLPVFIPAIALILGITGYYNYRTTSSPFRWAHQEYADQYHEISPFIFSQEIRQIEFNNTQQARYARMKFNAHQQQQSLFGGIRSFLHRLKVQWKFHLGVLFSIPLLFALHYRRKVEGFNLSFWTICLVIAGISLIFVTHGHYLAPVVSLILLLVVAGTRLLYRLSRQSGSIWLRSLFICLCVGMLLKPFQAFCWQVTRPDGFEHHRERIQQSLLDQGGRHVILVRYSPRHNPGREWVYNSADPDQSPVVWARDRGPEENPKIFKYYRDRTFWILAADATPPELIPLGFHDNNPDH